MKKLIIIVLVAIGGISSAQQMNFPDIRIGSSVTGKIAFKARFLHAPYIQDGLNTDSVLTIAGGIIKKVPRSQFSGGGGGAVNSVYGRTGDVVAVSTDYSSFYPLLTSTYNNPVWINTLAYSKITGVPAFAIDADVVHKTGDETIAGDKTFSGFSKIANMYVGNSTNNVQLTSGDIKYNIGSNLLSVYPLTLTANRVQRHQNDDGTIALTKNFATGQTIGANTSGSAASVPWTGVTSRPTALSQFTNDLGNYGGYIVGDGTLVAGFAANNVLSPYMRHTTSNAVVGLARQDGSNATGTWNVSTTGKATGTTLNDATTAGSVTSNGVQVGNIGVNTSVMFPTVHKAQIKTGTDNNLLVGLQSSEVSLETTNDAVNLARPLRIYSSKTQLNIDGGNVLIGTTTDNGTKLQVNGTSSLIGQVGVNGDVNVSGNVSANNLGSNTWTPTISNTSNISSSTAYQNIYSRVGNVITLSGSVRIATPATGATSFQINIPTSSAFTSVRDASGVASGNAVNFGTVQANTSNGNILISCVSSIGGVTQHDVFFTLQYIIK